MNHRREAASRKEQFLQKSSLCEICGQEGTLRFQLCSDEITEFDFIEKCRILCEEHKQSALLPLIEERKIDFVRYQNVLIHLYRSSSPNFKREGKRMIVKGSYNNVYHMSDGKVPLLFLPPNILEEICERLELFSTISRCLDRQEENYACGEELLVSFHEPLLGSLKEMRYDPCYSYQMNRGVRRGYFQKLTFLRVVAQKPIPLFLPPTLKSISLDFCHEAGKSTYFWDCLNTIQKSCPECESLSCQDVILSEVEYPDRAGESFPSITSLSFPFTGGRGDLDFLRKFCSRFPNVTTLVNFHYSYLSEDEMKILFPKVRCLLFTYPEKLHLYLSNSVSTFSPEEIIVNYFLWHYTSSDWGISSTKVPSVRKVTIRTEGKVLRYFSRLSEVLINSFPHLEEVSIVYQEALGEPEHLSNYFPENVKVTLRAE